MAERKDMKFASFPAKLDIDRGERTIVSNISVETIDRDSEILLVKGADLSQYRKNPVVLWAHDYQSLPPARNLWVKKDSGRLVAKTLFADTELGNQLFELYEKKFLSAFSVGFIPKKWHDGPTEKEIKDHPDWKGARRIYDNWELLEYSFVPVPSHPAALALAVQKGLKVPAEVEAELPEMEEAEQERELNRAITEMFCERTEGGKQWPENADWRTHLNKTIALEFLGLSEALINLYRLETSRYRTGEPVQSEAERIRRVCANVMDTNNDNIEYLSPACGGQEAHNVALEYVGLPEGEWSELISWHRAEDIVENNAMEYDLTPEDIDQIKYGKICEPIGEKPLPNFHACRLVNPDTLSDTCRTAKNDRDHEGKKYDVIYCREKNGDSWKEQAYRYPKGTWTAAEAGSHCKSHNGTFEAASEANGQANSQESITVLAQPPIQVLEPIKPEPPKRIQPIILTPLKPNAPKPVTVLGTDEEIREMIEAKRRGTVTWDK